jgi:uncharacterized YigZ family protein
VDSYLSLEDGDEVLVKVKGSRFLGQAFHAQSREEAREKIQSVRKHYHDARHVCSAMRLGPPLQTLEFRDDDGEPSGTGGAPMLDVLSSRELHDALVVVTRYFGGVKLGTGGLARAYGDAARAAVEAARGRTIERSATLSVSCGYGDVGAIEAVLAQAASGIRRADRSFEGTPVFTLQVLPSQEARLRALLLDATGGRASIDTRSSG